MRIAVTGTSGRIGSAVAAELHDRGHSVLGIDRVDPRAPIEGVDYLTVDLNVLDHADPRLADVEAVAHLGALMSWNNDDAEAIMAANVSGTLQLVRALEASALRRFVLASTGEVYPENQPQYQPLDEQHPRLPTTWYGLSKVVAEDVVAFAGRTQGWATLTLRFAHTQQPAELLDPDSFFSGPRFFASRRYRKESAAGNSAIADQLAAYADDDGTLLVAKRADGAPVQMGILAASDLAHGVVLALEAGTTGNEVVGLGPDSSTDLGEFARELAAAAGLDTVEVTLPVTAASYTTSNERARELLGFAPKVDRAEFVRQAAEAYRQRIA